MISMVSNRRDSVIKDNQAKRGRIKQKEAKRGIIKDNQAKRGKKSNNQGIIKQKEG